MTALHQAIMHFQSGDLTRAEPLLRQCLSQTPDDINALMLLAVLLWDRTPEEAAIRLHHLLSLQPSHPLAHHYLGKIQAAQGADEDARGSQQAALALQPGLAPAWNDLGTLHHRAGRLDEALSCFDQALAADPKMAAGHSNRAALLEVMQRPQEAFAAWKTALPLAPDPVPVLYALGSAQFRAGQHSDAERSARALLALRPGHISAMLLLADALDGQHRHDDARPVRTEAAKQRGTTITPCRSPQPVARLLLLAGAGNCNLPVHYLLSEDRYHLITLHLFDDEPAAELQERLAALPPFDLIFCSVADADGGPGYLDAAAQVRASVPAIPFLNHPEQIPPTRRDRIAALLADCGALVIPQTHRLSRQDAAHLPVLQPVLLRPAGSHGGHDLVRITTEEERDSYLSHVPESDYYVSEFHPYQNPDGYWRKYRLIFVAGRIYPYHLAIADQWLVHYWRADMDLEQWMKREEEAFLADWRAVFTPDQQRTLEAIAARMGLDYCGIDCTRLADGRILVFEANASMLVHLQDSEALFPYKHRYVPRIFAAMDDLVRARLAGG